MDDRQGHDSLRELVEVYGTWDEADLDDEGDLSADEPRHFWTRRRLLIAVILVLALASLLASDLAPLFDSPAPAPPVETVPWPGDRV
jgi:hypothetical protein